MVLDQSSVANVSVESTTTLHTFGPSNFRRSFRLFGFDYKIGMYDSDFNIYLENLIVYSGILIMINSMLIFLNYMPPKCTHPPYCC